MVVACCLSFVGCRCVLAVVCYGWLFFCVFVICGLSKCDGCCLLFVVCSSVLDACCPLTGEMCLLSVVFFFAVWRVFALVV